MMYATSGWTRNIPAREASRSLLDIFAGGNDGAIILQLKIEIYPVIGMHEGACVPAGASEVGAC